MRFPEKGLPRSEVRANLMQFEKKSRRGKETSAMLDLLFHLSSLPKLRQIAEEAMVMFMEASASSEGAKEMEDQLVSMIGQLWGNRYPAGNITTGGTESNFLALYAARQLSGMRKGSVVLPVTSHPSLLKACVWLGLEPVLVPVGDDLRVPADKVEQAIREDTLAIVATCGTCPYGTVDPIPEIAKIAKERSLYLHIDAAFGGLYLPWLARLGRKVPQYDFSVDGVCSISADPHKNGLGVYPAGCIIYRDEETKNAALFKYGSMSRGKSYSVTPTLLGTRPSLGIAVTWALFNYLGIEGYVRMAEKCVDSQESFIRGLQGTNALEPAAKPEINVMAVISKKYDIAPLKEKLSKKGWYFLNMRGEPRTYESAIVVVFAPSNLGNHERLLADLKRLSPSLRS